MASATSPPDPIAETLAMLWSPVLAITTHHGGRSNGLVATTGVFASLKEWLAEWAASRERQVREARRRRGLG
jgi:hypothetical protein